MDDDPRLTPALVIQRVLPLRRRDAVVHPWVFCRRIVPIFTGEIGRVYSERCGAEIHDSCYWWLAASASEWAAYHEHRDINLFVWRAYRS